MTSFGKIQRGEPLPRKVPSFWAHGRLISDVQTRVRPTGPRPIVMSNADPILTAPEIASELRCSKTHVYNLMNGCVDGVTVLPHLALGRKKVVPRSAFETWKRTNLTGKMPHDLDMNGVDA